MTAQRIISADDHMDLHVLPPALFSQRVPRALRERAPRVEQGPDGAVWKLDGRVVGSSGSQRGSGIVWASRRRASTTTASAPPIPHCAWPTWTSTGCTRR